MQHHASLLVGPVDWAVSKLPPEYSKSSQDVRFLKYDSMTIAHARDLIKETSLKPTEKELHVFVIIADTILREAQNALLKLFEEPNKSVLFYLILPKEDVLLPTLKSRLHILEIYSGENNEDAFSDFLKSSYADRLECIDKKIKAEDTEWVSQIINGLETHAHKSKDAKLIEDVLMVKKYIHTKGASKKMLLEHISLSL